MNCRVPEELPEPTSTELANKVETDWQLGTNIYFSQSEYLVVSEVYLRYIFPIANETNNKKQKETNQNEVKRWVR